MATDKINWGNIDGMRIEIRFDPEDGETVRDAIAHFIHDTTNCRISCTLEVIHDLDKRLRQ